MVPDRSHALVQSRTTSLSLLPFRECRGVAFWGIRTEEEVVLSTTKIRARLLAGFGKMKQSFSSSHSPP